MVVLAQLVRAFVCGTKGHGVVARTLPKGEVAEFGLLRLFAKQVNPLKGFGGSNPFFTAKIYIENICI